MYSNEFDTNNRINNDFVGDNGTFYEEPDKYLLFSQKIRNFFTSKAFLVAAIAMTVSAVGNVIYGAIPIFVILFAIGMLLAYSTAKRETPLKEIRFLKGTVKVYYILTIVGIVFLLVVAVILIAFGPAIISMGDTFDTAMKSELTALDIDLDDLKMFGLSEADIAILADAFVETGLSMIFGILFIVMGVVFIIAAVFSILINELIFHKLKKQLTLTVEALENHKEAELKLGGIKTAFLVFGVFEGISAFFALATLNIFSLCATGGIAVAYFALYSALANMIDRK